jgi:hypothetical protein
MVRFSMRLYQRMTWLGIVVEKATYLQIFLLHVSFVYYFVTFSVDGKEVQLTVGYLARQGAVTSRSPPEPITSVMQVFRSAIPYWFHTEEQGIISTNGFKVDFSMPFFY